jgi:multidrug efflux system outer membrane protein
MRLLLIATLLLSSCALGPDFVTPSPHLETSFKSAGFQAPPAEGSWWSLFEDPSLTGMIEMAEKENPSVLAAFARYEQARAALGVGRAGAFPVAGGDAFGRRQGDSRNSNFSAGTYNDYRAALNLSWEIDLWGRVRRQIGAAVADRDAAELDHQAALLSLRGEIARAYLSLRFADAEIALLEETAELRKEARRLMKARFDGGASSSIDHDRAATEHESILAELDQLRAQRARYENALAALTGQSAAGFRIAPNRLRPRIPTVPAAVPSDLLSRRPDIAASERRLAAASERIGLVIASSLPRISITGDAGVRSLRASELFNPASKLWSLGPGITLPEIQGSRIGGENKRAAAVYREALQNYRDTLLRAVQETEDSLGDARLLATASTSRERGAASAEQAAKLTRERYTGGVTDYFEVVDAERTALVEHRASLTIDLARALAATRFIQSLGGGWER